MKRVVITGIGAVTPLGNSIRLTWENLLHEKSGVTGISKFDASGLPSRIAGELKNFSPEKYLPRKDVLRLDPFVHYACAAACMALEDARLINQKPEVSSQKSVEIESTRRRNLNSNLLRSAGVVIGSSRGGITSMGNALEKHMLTGRRFSPYLMSSSTVNMASSYISTRYGIKGPAIGISTACASGTSAVGEAFKMIRYGELDIALAGGSEAPICRLAVGGYGASGALSRRNTEPERASRPFDKDRDGFVIAEGAGVLVLEDMHHAAQRGAQVYAELAGYGTSSDAYHQTRPDSGGEATTIQRALKDAGISPDSVSHVNAHATSTPLGDAAEAAALKKVFGEKTRAIHVSSSKSMLGHMLGAAGAIEAAITALSIQKSIITPIINMETPDPACDLSYARSAIKKNINVAISNSFGFGGVNAVLVLKKCND